MEHLHKWIFAWNNITKTWDTVKKENYFDLTNDRKKVLSSTSIGTLVDIIERTDGDKEKIKNLTSKLD